MNPLLYLDLHQRQRQRSLLVLRIVLLSILALFTAGALVVPLLEDGFSDPSALSDGLCTSFLVVQGVAMLMLAPFGAADRLSRETEQRTMPALLNSPASPAGIFFGKLAGAYVFDVFLWCLFLPFIAVNALFCTIHPLRIVLVALSNLATGFYLSLVALSISARSKRALHSFLRLGVAYLVWFVFFPILFAIVADVLSGNDVGETVATCLAVVCFAHAPVAPQIGFLGLFEAMTFPLNLLFGLSIPLLWSLVILLQIRLALRSLPRSP